MIPHIKPGESPEERSRVIASLIRKGEITLGGYRKAKIYGLLSCASGKRMKAINRVFFAYEAEALANGYRPCAHCMKQQYQKWKRENAG
jgi:methylphosphotriester-DNA--protein-cysteine methyltransferase